ERLQDLARLWAPQGVAAPGPGDICDTHIETMPPRLPPQPGDVVRAERGSRDDQERVVLDPSDGEIRLDAAPIVKRLRVRDVPDRTRNLVVADQIEKCRGLGATDLDRRER